MNLLTIPIRKLRDEAFCRLLVLRFHHNFVIFHLLCPKHAFRDNRVICKFLEYDKQLGHYRFLENFFHRPFIFHENVELDVFQVEDVCFHRIFCQIGIKIIQEHNQMSVVDVFYSLRADCPAFNHGFDKRRCKVRGHVDAKKNFTPPNFHFCEKK